MPSSYYCSPGFLLGFIPTKQTKVYEDDEEVVTCITANKITPKLRHIHLPLAHLRYDHTKGVFQALQTANVISITNTRTKPRLGSSLIRYASIAMGHAHIQDNSQENCSELIKPATNTTRAVNELR